MSKTYWSQRILERKYDVLSNHMSQRKGNFTLKSPFFQCKEFYAEITFDEF